MDNLKKRYFIFQKTLASFYIILDRIKLLTINDQNYLPFRDSVIQRFKYSVDTFLKFLNEYLEKKYGVQSIPSPKMVIKSAVENFLINKEEFPLFILMIDDRNITSHTYNEELAEEIFNKIPKHYQLLNNTFKRISIPSPDASN